MNIFKHKYIPTQCLLVAIILTLTACSLDVSNPNSATEEDVLSSAEGIRSFAIGMQGYYSETAYPDVVLNTGVTTRELAINTTFSSLVELEDGGTSLPGGNSRLNSIWDVMFRVVSMTGQLINNAPNVITDDAELSGIMAMSELYRAMALGYLIQSFEQSPIQAGDNVEFQSRGDVLAEVIRLLDSARQRINQTPPSSSFGNNILLTGFDLANTIDAMRARYNLLAGNYQAAIDASNEVDMSATSVFNYDGSTTRNPIFDGVAQGDEGQEYAPRDNFGTSVTESGDQRLDFYLNQTSEQSTPNGLPIDNLVGFFTSASASIPVYLPGEMNLIRAEAYVNQDRPGDAVDEIDNIRTKQPSEDPFGVGADLPAYSGGTSDAALFEEIYQQRSAELFLTGMRFEDMRRLNRPVPSNDPALTAPRNRVYYPYPNQERQNNPNTPENPPI